MAGDLLPPKCVTEYFQQNPIDEIDTSECPTTEAGVQELEQEAEAARMEGDHIAENNSVAGKSYDEFACDKDYLRASHEATQKFKKFWVCSEALKGIEQAKPEAVSDTASDNPAEVETGNNDAAGETIPITDLKDIPKFEL